ncbi:MAG: hypothetical protein M5U15_09050 [Kiritimatiellae bacterium]|nr:hypothetical protein [Kiritimatiellia bacterium]
MKKLILFFGAALLATSGAMAATLGIGDPAPELKVSEVDQRRSR